MLRVITESTLSKSLSFNELNKSSTANQGKSQYEKAVNLIKTGKILKNEDIEASYVAVRQITDTLTRAAMKAFDSEQVQLVYNTDVQKSVMQAIPFMTLKTASGYKTFVFVDKYVSVSRDGVLQIQPAILRDFLIAGTVSNGLKKNYNNLISNQDLEEMLMNIYQEMVFRVINREYSIAADKQLAEKTKYFINRFFLHNVFGSIDSPDNIEKLAKSHMKDGVLDEFSLQEIKRIYDDANPQDLREFFEIVKGLSPRMKTLALGVFWGGWVDYYYSPAALAIDNIEYLIFAAITLLSGNNIINISASEIVKETKKIKSFRSELLKLL